MPRLSDLQLASLLEEIAAAMRVNTPVVNAMARLRMRRLGSVGRVADQIVARLEQGMTVAESIKVVRNPMVGSAVAAVTSCERSADPSLLSHIANQLRTRYEFGRTARISWLYPFLLLVIAYVVAVVVMMPLVLGNVGRDFSWNPWVVDLCRWLSTSWMIPPIVFAIFVLVLLLKYWVVRKMPKHVGSQLFFRSLADQFQYNVPEDVAIHNAALMAGDTELLNEPHPTLQSPLVVARMSATETPFKVLHDSIGTKETLIAQFRYLAEVHRERARQHDYVWGRLVPRIAMVLVGGGLTIAYAWWIIRPVYQQVVQW